jgi:hypothetical protein
MQTMQISLTIKDENGRVDLAEVHNVLNEARTAGLANHVKPITTDRYGGLYDLIQLIIQNKEIVLTVVPFLIELAGRQLPSGKELTITVDGLDVTFKGNFDATIVAKVMNGLLGDAK